MARLEHRIQALERATPNGPGFTMIAIQVVRPGDLAPENRHCAIEGITYTCGAAETPSEFEHRMRRIAEELNQRLGRPIRIICSPTDISA